MICRYGMLFQLYPLPNLNPHQPQFITKSYGTSCSCNGGSADSVQGITFSDYLLHAHTNYNFGRTHRHKFRRLVPLAGCACILRDEFTKIYTRSHKMSFIHVHMIQRPKAIHVYGYKSVEELVKAKKIAIRGDGKSPDQKVIDMQLQAANLVYIFDVIILSVTANKSGRLTVETSFLPLNSSKGGTLKKH